LRSLARQISTECEIHTFDFLSLEQSFNKPSYVNYHAYGLGKQDRVFGAQMQNQEYTLPSIVKMLGHEGRSIEIFKIDCEGCELEVSTHVSRSGEASERKEGALLRRKRANEAASSGGGRTCDRCPPSPRAWSHSVLGAPQPFLAHVLDGNG
jgi:hypothetical protein